MEGRGVLVCVNVLIAIQVLELAADARLDWDDLGPPVLFGPEHGSAGTLLEVSVRASQAACGLHVAHLSSPR